MNSQRADEAALPITLTEPTEPDPFTSTELGVMPARPSDDEIIDHLADHFDDHPMNVLEWIATMDLQAQRERIREGRSS